MFGDIYYKFTSDRRDACMHIFFLQQSYIMIISGHFTNFVLLFHFLTLESFLSIFGAKTIEKLKIALNTNKVKLAAG